MCRVVLTVLLAALLGLPAAAQSLDLPATPAESDALDALRRGKFVRARELSSELLELAPHSHVARYVFGVALHEGEGNVPLALRHLRMALSRVESPSGDPRPGHAGWHEEILRAVSYALSDLGRHEELLEVNARLRRLYPGYRIGTDVWPLMKLHRIDEARDAARRALATGEDLEALYAKNGLCAMDGYAACIDMLEAAREVRMTPTVALGNAALAAMEVGRYAEAEEYLLEATRTPDLYTNPWRQLVGLYVSQARLSEAFDAGRRMAELAALQPTRQGQHHEAQNMIAASELLLAAGLLDEALEAAAQARARPDRTSHVSGDQNEIHAEGWIVERRVRLALAERLAEAASVAPWYRGPLLAARAASQRFGAWLSERRVKRLVLDGGLRPWSWLEGGDTPQVEAPEWLYPDTVGILGAGAALALVSDLREAGDDERIRARIPLSLWNAHLDSLEAEARWMRGDDEACLVTGERARAGLPSGAILLRTRLAALMADAASRTERPERAWPLFDEVLATDPGSLRRLGIPLPARLAVREGDAAADAARRAKRSPRFRAHRESPFLVASRGDRVCLVRENGGELACAALEAPSAEGDRPEDRDRRARASEVRRVVPDPSSLGSGDAALAFRFLREAFAPRIDLSQQGLAGLDGSPVVSRGMDSAMADDLIRPRRRGARPPRE